MSFVARNFVRSGARSLPRTSPLSTVCRTNTRSITPRAIPAAATLQQKASFAMSAPKASVPSSGKADPASAQKYDDEVADMASYIHNYDVKSDLAVRLCCELSSPNTF